jgi:hypothetical protein
MVTEVYFREALKGFLDSDKVLTAVSFVGPCGFPEPFVNWAMESLS